MSSKGKPKVGGDRVDVPPPTFSAGSPRDAAEPCAAANESHLGAIGEWSWEGKVADTLEGFLKKDGWTITEKADTFSRQRGPDLVATKDQQHLVIEVKGFPSKRYRDDRRQNETKKTHPSGQAKHWLSEALFAAICLRKSHPESSIAIALPDIQRYRDLLDRTGDALRLLAIGVFLVKEDGSVSSGLSP